MKFGQAKHCTNDTGFLSTGQSTASFFILAICFPPAAPFSSSTYCFGVGGAFAGVKMSTTYFVAGGSSDNGQQFLRPVYPLIILSSGFSRISVTSWLWLCHQHAKQTPSLFASDAEHEFPCLKQPEPTYASLPPKKSKLSKSKKPKNSFSKNKNGQVSRRQE